MRLNIEKQEKLEPVRMEYAKNQIKSLGLEIEYETSNVIHFLYNKNRIILYPYSGWHSGKGINAGRGIDNLLKQLKR